MKKGIPCSVANNQVPSEISIGIGFPFVDKPTLWGNTS
jgi:hypothetical protein